MKNQKFNWCLTCEFSIFARSLVRAHSEFTADWSSDTDIINHIAVLNMLYPEENERMNSWSTDFKNIKDIWNCPVEIRPAEIVYDDRLDIKYTVLSLHVYGYRGYEYAELKCKCINPGTLIKNISVYIS